MRRLVALCALVLGTAATAVPAGAEHGIYLNGGGGGGSTWAFSCFANGEPGALNWDYRTTWLREPAYDAGTDTYDVFARVKELTVSFRPDNPNYGSFTGAGESHWKFNGRLANPHDGETTVTGTIRVPLVGTDGSRHTVLFVTRATIYTIAGKLTTAVSAHPSGCAA